MSDRPELIPFPIQPRGYSAPANAFLAPKHHHSVIYVYAIRCGDFVKVGISGNVQQRIRSMECDNPFRLKLLIAAPCYAHLAGKAEAAAHQRLIRYHHRGEWFDCPDGKAREAVKAAPYVAAGLAKPFQVHPQRPLAKFDTEFGGQGNFPFDLRHLRRK